VYATYFKDNEELWNYFRKGNPGHSRFETVMKIADMNELNPKSTKGNQKYIF